MAHRRWPRISARRTLIAAVLIGVGVTAFSPMSAQAGPLAAGSVGARSGATQGTAHVTLVHGVRGLLADVLVDGHTVLKGFAYERATSPLALSAGSHKVQLFAAGQSHTTPLLDTPLRVKAGQTLSAAVGFGPSGDPKLFVFDDRLLAATHSSSSIVVRNVSQGAAPQLLIDGRVASSALTPGAETVKGVSPGSHTVGLKVNGAWILTNQPVRASAGRAMVVYIVGRQSATSVSLVAESMRPSTNGAAVVDSGGQAPDLSRARMPGWLSLGVLELGLLVTGGVFGPLAFRIFRGSRRGVPDPS